MSRFLAYVTPAVGHTLPLVRELLEEGCRRRKLLERHRALSLELAKVRMRGGDAEKKTTGHLPRCPR